MTQQAELRKIAEGREAEIFAWEDGTILKLYREGFSPRQPAHEAAAMDAAHAAGAPVPASHGVTTVMGRPGLIMERVDGLDLLTQIAKKPWTLFGGRERHGARTRRAARGAGTGIATGAEGCLSGADPRFRSRAW